MMKVTLEASPEVIKMHHSWIIKNKKNGCIISCASSLQMPSRISVLSIMEELGLWRWRGRVLLWQKRDEGSDDVVRATPQEVLCCKTITTLRSDLILSWYVKPYISFKKGSVPLVCSLTLNIFYWNKWLFLKKSISVINVILWFINM